MKKVAVITGCNRGLGEGIKTELLKAGYYVYGLNRTPTTIFSNSYQEFICDVSNPEEVEKACKKIDAKIAHERNMKRKNHDEFESLDSLKYYETLYEKAVKFLKENSDVIIVEIDASRSTQESIQQVKEILQNERFD